MTVQVEEKNGRQFLPRFFVFPSVFVLLLLFAFYVFSVESHSVFLILCSVLCDEKRGAFLAKTWIDMVGKMMMVGWKRYGCLGGWSRLGGGSLLAGGVAGGL